MKGTKEQASYQRAGGHRRPLTLPRKSHQCVAGISGRNRNSDGGGIDGEAESDSAIGEKRDRERNGEQGRMKPIVKSEVKWKTSLDRGGDKNRSGYIKLRFAAEPRHLLDTIKGSLIPDANVNRHRVALGAPAAASASVVKEG
ncbi:hypothetical protein EVAR_24659_1 [Eumeta japonica]|uniref:Uncharacterized protein n=1 Tax=Eumeta variegata TaxID=151549 RepID=A0A4C1V2Q1_EUMVA|nr:hypothetical protein EVAR_24659_1 [Eumeta japonica]